LRSRALLFLSILTVLLISCTSENRAAAPRSRALETSTLSPERKPQAGEARNRVNRVASNPTSPTRESGRRSKAARRPGSAPIPNGNLWNPSISRYGRRVAFESNSTNLVSRDTNGKIDIFVRDSSLKRTTRISISSSGLQGNADSQEPVISADGNKVAFVSAASNLVARDTNATGDVFVRDMVAHEMKRVSVSSAGLQANGGSKSPAISRDGRFVAFESVATNLVVGDDNGGQSSGESEDVFVHDTQTGQTLAVSVTPAGTTGRGQSYRPSISGDGFLVAFFSTADLGTVEGGRDTNEMSDVFVRDLRLGKTSRVSISPNGEQFKSASTLPDISEDGRYVAFATWRTRREDDGKYVDLFVRELEQESTTLAGACGESGCARIELSADGSILAWMDGISIDIDICNVRDRFQQERTKSLGACGSKSLSVDGRFVTFRRETAECAIDGKCKDGPAPTIVYDRTTGRSTPLYKW
jgi:Tol biopolymer transport system component